MFRIEITTDLDSLLSNQDHWNRLARGVPFRETSWLGPWWRCFGSGRQAIVLLARDEDRRIRGILPLYRDSPDSRDWSMIGDERAYSDYVSLLASDQDVNEVACAFGKFLASTASDQEFGWDLISIDGVVEGDRPMTALATALSSHHATVHAQSRMSTWYRAAESDWPTHLKSFSKTQRRRMKRWATQVANTEELEKIIADSEEQVETLVGDTIDLHQKRWNAAGEPGSFADPTFRRFIHEVCRDLFRRRRLHLPAILRDGKTIAGELDFIGGDRKLYSYTAGYDIDAAQLEPGRILNAETLNDLYRESFAGIDYLRGDEPYKKRMGARPRRVLNLRLISPAWFPRLRHAAWCTQFGLKQWVRKRTGRTPIEVHNLAALSG